MMKFSFKKNTHSKNLSHHKGFNIAGRVVKDWLMLLVVFVCLVIFVGAVDGYLLLKINQGDFFHSDIPGEVSAETVKRKKLVDVVEYFDARKAEYNQLWSTSTPQMDPSI